MAFSQQEKQKLVQIIGWNQFLKGDFTQIDNAINFVQAVPDGNIPTNDTENLIRAEITRIAMIDGLLDECVQAAILSTDAKTKLAAPSQFVMLLNWGNRSVAKICRTLGVRPIGGGYYAQYQQSTPDVMAM